MSKRPVTSEHQEPGDISFLFRAQNRRTLDEIDVLLRRQEKLRQLLGNERADEIEKQPDLFYNHERFRIWQAKARFWSIFTTSGIVISVSTILNGGRGGWDLIKRRYGIATPLIALTYATNFFVLHRFFGYNNEVYNEQTFAKNHKMLRNLIIKQ